jgi:type II restriction/modification system DNA methylase subunit YeeA
MTPQEFVAKWRGVHLKERAAAQEHFLDLCRLVGHPTPAEDDPTGERFTFEAGASKQAGGQGWADVWKREYFAWEYKGKHADLKKAYDQLLQYRESLVNPPLLVVSDIDTIIVHTNFTNTIKQIITITLNDLLTPAGMRNLHAIFYEPTHFRAPQTTAQVTRKAAEEFALLADNLRHQGEPSPRIAHFLIRLLFGLFSEDIELLPKGLFTRLIEQGRRNPQTFVILVRQLFQAMSTGGYFGADLIRYFDGGLFDDDTTLVLNKDGLEILYRVSALDWSNIEPSIFGTLFQRSLDPSRRSQLGAHYTSKDDILLIVEPVLMAPLRKEWETVKTAALDLASKRDSASTPSLRTRYANELERLIGSFLLKLSSIRVLDPACGSGNFLYVALRLLLDLWKEVSTFASSIGLPLMLTTNAPSPEQLFGIEIDEYAHELAQATVWIGYIQWLHENGFGVPTEPILKKLDNIKHMDAILAYDADGKPVEPEWPVADVIIGNPPFLGDKKMRGDLGDKYVDDLRNLYEGQILGGSDLVTYWFERARVLIVQGRLLRAGLLATNSIRNGTNQRVLAKIKESGDIFMAWSDRPWILDSAAVRVSMVGFDNGSETERILDGRSVNSINSDLSYRPDVTTAKTLGENSGICYLGMMKAGPFDIDDLTAEKMLSAPINPNGRYNGDVVRPRFAGQDITKRPRYGWIIDFGVDMSEDGAALYELPFEYLKKHVKPIRDENRRASLKKRWWIYGEPRRNLRQAIQHLARMIVTPEVSKYRVFTWLPTAVVPDHKLHVFARDDDYFFGVLHSYIHQTWSLTLGSTLEDRPSYSSSRTFETFPFPWPPGQELTDDPKVQAIAQAAKELVEKRDAWLNPPGLGETELKKRTLTNLYNARPTWLDLAHKKLDKAVLAAYGWPDLMTDAGINEDEVLARLLALNLERAKAQPAAQSRLIEDDADED